MSTCRYHFFLLFSKFPFKYVNIHIFSSKHKLYLLCILFVEEDILIIFQFMIGVSPPHHHHHHVALVARISLTLSRHSALSFIALGRSSGQHPVSSHSC